MIIRKMTASFGKLENESLELGAGLNIIYAPNEGGKSTWCGFLKAMLYGIDSAAREKGGVKPDKILYAPWSGTPMSGSMDISFEDKEITLLRRGREAAPMRDFSAVVAGSADPVRGLEGKTAGEALTGVSRDVFERTAFIGQGKIGVSSSPELEKRIAAIVRTGEEDASVTESADRLRAAMRRRRHNRSGRLPELEQEMEALRTQLAENERENASAETLQQAKVTALERRDLLLEKVAEARKGTRRKTLDSLNESRVQARRLEENYTRKTAALEQAQNRLDTGLFGHREPEDCRAQWAKDERRLSALNQEAKKGGGRGTNIALLALFVLLSVLFELLTDFQLLPLEGLLKLLPRLVLGLLALGQTVRLLRLYQSRRALSRERKQLFANYSAQSEAEITGLIDSHEAAFFALETARQEQTTALSDLETARRQQSELEAALLRNLDFTEGEGEAAHYTRLLEEAEAALRRIREQVALGEGRQSMRETPEALRERLSVLSTEYDRLRLEFEALALAHENLIAAGEEISQRITPVLSARTAELFSHLTGARYSAILLDKELRASARLSDSPLPREAAFLSTGTADQLYLAVRLALCELALSANKACPIILDDALVSFDDGRCEKALSLLNTLSKERQILLFTCHRRELDLAGSYEQVSVLEI